MALESILLKQADQIANQILGEDRHLQGSWLRWGATLRTKTGSIPEMAESYLHFLAEVHTSDFTSILSSCQNPEGSYSIYNLLAHLSASKREAVVKKLGLKWDPRPGRQACERGSHEDILKKGIGTKLSELLAQRYGFDFESADPILMADLLHTAYFHEFAGVADSHLVVRTLADYLNSSSYFPGDVVHTSHRPSLDSIVAFANSYDDIGIIEDILYDIERSRISKRLLDSTKPIHNNPTLYKQVVGQELALIVQDLTQQRESATLDGTKNIFDKLLEVYRDLQHEPPKTVVSSLGTWAFPRIYQVEAAREIVNHKRFLVAYGTGTGKTAVDVLASEYLAQELNRSDFRTLIVTTNTNKHQIADKVASYLGLEGEVRERTIRVIEATSRKDDYVALCAGRYAIINYELLIAKDWDISDFASWEVNEEEATTLRLDLKREYEKVMHRYEEYGFVLGKIPRRFHETMGGDLEKAYDAYVKITDLNRKKSVVESLETSFRPDHIVFDELQNARGIRTRRGKSVRDIAQGAEYVTCSTATPFVNGLSDLSVIFDVLGVYDDLLHDRREEVERIEAQLSVTGESLDHLEGPQRETLFAMRRELQALEKSIERGDVQAVLLNNPRMVRDYLRPRMVYRPSSALLDLPPITFIPALEAKSPDYDDLIHLPMYQRFLYEIVASHNFRNGSDQLRALQMLLLSPGLYGAKFEPGEQKSGSVYPHLPASLQQGGHLDNERSEKYQRLEQIIDRTLGDPSKRKKNVLVLSPHYKEGVLPYLERRLRERFEDVDVIRIDGDIVNRATDDLRTRLVNQFNESPRPTVLLAMSPIVSEGIDLHHRCSTVVNLDLPFTWAQYEQGPIGRVLRADQDESVTVYNLMVSNSLDLGKLDLILQKRKFGDLLLSGYPLNAAELKVLDLQEGQVARSGFLDTYFKRTVSDSMKIMRDLYGAGAEKVREYLGSHDLRSEVYADAYIINLMSVASLRSIAREMIELEILNPDNPTKLDGKVLDLAAGYGSFSHFTGVATHNLEINPIMIERAADYAPRAQYQQGVMQDISSHYAAQQFRWVILALGFHYTSDDERGQLLYDIYNRLEERGYLSLTFSPRSIDETGRAQLVEVLQYTGYEIHKQAVVHCADKTLFEVIARKTGPARLYSQPFALRSKREHDEDTEDIEDIARIKGLYEPTADDVTPRDTWSAEFGPRFGEFVK